MKRAVSYILASVVVIAVAAYLVFFLGMGAKRHGEQVCAGVKIVVADTVSTRFITPKDVEECIRTGYGECRGMLVEEVNPTKIEDILHARNAVLKAEAYFTPDGILNVDVVQRVPALHFKNDNEDFYADGDGYVFHSQSSGTEHIMTVGGCFPVNVGVGFQGVLSEEDGGKWLRDMLDFSHALAKSGMGKDVSVSVLENGDIVLCPSEGHPQFIFGHPEDFSVRFARIREYYSAIVPKEGADCYSTVILKYAGQIVCRK